ncbi:MAG: cupin domain-containing protein [Pseudohongiellaceae bacterium]
MTNKAYLSLALGSVLMGAMTVHAQDSPVSQFEPLAVPLDTIEWGPPGGGNGVPLGVQTAQQGIDPTTGGITYYAKFPAGSHFDLHWHTHDEFVVVVQGTVTIVLGEQSHLVSTGSYIVIPGKMNHSWDVPANGEDAVIVVRRGGPADFNFVH